MDNVPEIEEEDARGGNWARFKIVAGKMTGQYSGKLRLGTAQRLCLTHTDAIEWTGPSDNPIYDNIAGGIYLEHNDTISDLHIYASKNNLYLSMIEVGDTVRLKAQDDDFDVRLKGVVTDLEWDDDQVPRIRIYSKVWGNLPIIPHEPWKITGWTPKPTYRLPDMSNVPAHAIRFFICKDGETIVVYMKDEEGWAFIGSDDFRSSKAFEKYYQEYLPLKPARLEEVDDDDED